MAKKTRQKTRTGNNGTSKKTDRLLKRTYYDPGHAGSFGGIDALKRAVGSKVSTGAIKKWLRTQDTYTLHKPIRRRFKRRRIVVADIDEQWEADLVDMSKLSKYNKNFKYLLTVIDTLSKYAWVVPLRTKTGEEQVSAFAKIFAKSKRKPANLRTDKGGEFLGKRFQAYLKKENINFYIE
ncbi:uncharacterized protein LOC135484818 [Lineus longissimus]|uniref:uncharacterized protein LOC135484818 n=1 Tax=Lineus longissimus TaxID=88925 RepID=UPI00315CC596